MKKVLAYTFGVLLMAGCQSSDCSNGLQDGNETGVDCGGDCSPCSVSNPNGYLPLSGSWYWNASRSLEISQTNMGGTSASGNIKIGSNCIVEFTNGSTSPGVYTAYGMLNTCNYPTQSNYYYDPNNNLITNIHHVDSQTPDSLILSSQFGGLYYSSVGPLQNLNNVVLNYEIELEQSYPTSNEVDIVLDCNLQGQDVVIPIVPGQLTYQGTVVMDASSQGGNVAMKLVTTASLQNGVQPNLLAFSAKLKLGSFVVAEIKSYELCIGGDGSLCQSAGGVAGVYSANGANNITLVSVSAIN